jgi:hypothetical protein
VQELRITDTLDPNLDWSTFQLTSIAYGGRILDIQLPSGVLEYTTQDIPPTATTAGTTQGQMLIGITVTLDIQTGQLEWYVKAIDSATGDLPADPLAGFLPPEDGTGRGQGYVTFSIKPKADMPLNTVIRNKVSIVFDTNNPIETNEVSNLVAEAADLVLLAQSPAQGSVGQQMTTRYTVLNDGPDPATSVVFTANIGQSATLTSITASQGTCTGLTCTLGTLGVGSSVEVVLITTPTVANLQELTGSVTTATIELNGVDNTATTATTVTEGGGYLYLPLITK